VQAPTALAMMEARRWGCAEALSLKVGADLQIGIDRRRRAKPEVWVLTVAERASTAFSGVVRRLPRRLAQECAQPPEVVSIQVLQLSAQRHHFGRLGICLPQLVVLLSVDWGAALPLVVFPNAEPRLKERSGHTKFTSDGPSQQVAERLTLLVGEVGRLVEEERAVES
jgi:hypothetical protein